MTTKELEKAAHNLRRSEEFLAARGRWTLDSVGRTLMRSTHDTVQDMCQTVEAILLYNDIPLKTDPRQEADQVPTSTFDVDRLQRFASFFDRLHQWFLNHAKGEVEAGAEALLGQIYGSLMAIHRSTGKFLEWSSDDSQSAVAPEEAPESPPAIPPAASAMVDRVFDGAPSKKTTKPARPTITRPHLVLSENLSDPWYQWVSPSDIKLTESARKRIFKFLVDHGVEFFKYQMEQFADEVRRRIENAPEGYILVIKIGGDDKDRKPYLGYEPAEDPP
jgi:hypothetical protein